MLSICSDIVEKSVLINSEISTLAIHYILLAYYHSFISENKISLETLS